MSAPVAAPEDAIEWPERLLRQGRAERLGGHQPIRLSDLNRAWLVRQGQVELFLVSLSPDGVEGTRHYLATVPAGGLLLGIGLDDSADFVLLAVPHVDTDLIEWPLALLSAESAAPDVLPALVPALEHWLRALSWGMSRWVTPLPVVDVGIGTDERLSIPSGRRCTAQQVLIWIRLAPEAGLFLDTQEIDSTADEVTFPLAAEAWLWTMTALELHGRSTAAALRDGDAWDGVATLHRLLFETASMNLMLGNADEYNRLMARRVATEAERDHAFSDLMSVTAPRPRLEATPVRGDIPLVGAMRLVGQACGFQIQVPVELKSDDALTLENIVRFSRLRQRTVTLRDDWWQGDFGALLAFEAETQRPLALLYTDQGRAQLIDPADGQELDFETHRQRLAPEAFEFTTHLPFRAMGFRSLFGFAFARGWRDAVLMLVMSAMAGMMTLAIPVTTAYLIDTAIPNHEVGHLIEIGVVLAVLGGTAFVVDYVATLAFTRAESRMGRALQSGLLDRVLRLPMRFFQNFSAGDLANRVMAMTQIQTLLSTGAVNAILSGIFGLAGFLLMFYYDARLALWALVLTLVYLILSLVISYLRLRQERALAGLMGDFSNILLHLILGVAKIRLAAAEDRAFARLASPYAKSRRHQLRSQRLGAWQSALNQVLALIGLLIFVLLIGKPSQAPNLIAIGAFSALLVAFQQFSASLSMMVMVATGLIAIQPQVERARPLLTAVPEVSEERKDPGALSGAIEVSHVSFRYTPNGPLILDDVSLEIEPGRFVALVGASGSGKSTLLRLIMGFESLESGGIFFDGQALTSVDATAVRRQMGVVMQNAQLMPGSLYQNIVGTSGGSLDDAWEAATQVGLADDIHAMPMGMQTVIMEGGGALSGGQMQRLMIARAIVNRPKVLLLDEATSALDNRTQAVVTESLDRLRVTRIVVAHRLSTVVNAERIHVMDAGRIVESGNYASLMQANGQFARLAARQMV
ncbi:NHLM bacteriocin system ABC transporter, ATP-binding protein [Thiorhodovibrio frisius]|uniref:NHLM bacteriocin system ABC transporter, ATP-binding protein n=1 Tax=Thiorhodovibrio frisius TaxID=631362 RepID=H8Z2N2_9GAMM|nr:NHLM bacteriocin system ABC transporter, ATP-binding protein [Thiorhodovibrio frisius]WPL22481.1 Alpha-hemolysin translocation ATP-binding protein HlyB [Thiorhodovibrio frisius]